jgi:tetratricopeptide (TPR) repeat protein
MITLCNTAYAAIPYDCYGFRTDKTKFYIQTVYEPADPYPTIGSQLYIKESGKKKDVQGFEEPSNLYIDSDDFIYVVDKAQNRAVKITDQGELLVEYGTGKNEKGLLREPEGVYVAKNGDIYVSDTGNNRIAIFNNEGAYKGEIIKPQDDRIKDIGFLPTRVAIDIRGFYYLVIKGVNQGLMVLTPDGRFDGFFGSNKTQLTIFDKFKQFLYTHEQKVATQVVADSVNDVFIDGEGYIYTATLNTTTEQIKKYNVGADNIFKGKNMEVFPVPAIERDFVTAFCGVTVDSYGNVYAMDTGTGRVFQYDKFGMPVLCYGEKLWDKSDLRSGLFGDASSIRINSRGFIYVTDRLYKAIHVFRPTEFVKKIHTADFLYNDGKYTEAAQYAEEVLKLNVYFDKANMIIGKKYYKDKQWALAMKEFEKAMDTTDYSSAFWELRLEWIQKNFGYIILALVILYSSYLVIFKILIKKVLNARRSI